MWNDEESRDSATQPTEFVAKLYGMLENPSYKGIVAWSDTQDSFLILDIAKFQEQIIPKEFNHSNFSSFVRQLNKYDFHKQRFQGSSSKIWEFKHKNFVPENKTRAHVIKRKGPSSRNNAALQEQIEDLNGQLLDVYARMDKLESDNARLLGMIEQQQNYIAMVGQNHAQGHVQMPVAPAVPTPVVQAPPQLTSSPSVPVAVTPPSKVLVAMSAGDIRTAISNIVSEVGHFVDCTESGLEAINMIKAAKYQALIVEPILSQVSGSEAAEQIRESLGSQFPIIMTDGIEGGDLQAKDAYYRDKGVDTVLWRPFAKAQLIDILHDYIN